MAKTAANAATSSVHRAASLRLSDRGVEALGEPGIDLGQHRAGLVPPPLLGEQRAFKTVSAARQTRVRPARNPVFTDPTEDQPPSFPCVKRQLSIVSM